MLRDDPTEHSGITNDVTFGPEGFTSTIEWFQRYACGIQHEKPAFIVPRNYCTSTTINDPRLFTDHVARLSSRRQANLQFVELVGRNYKDISEYRLIFVQIIAEDEETW